MAHFIFYGQHSKQAIAGAQRFFKDPAVLIWLKQANMFAKTCSLSCHCLFGSASYLNKLTVFKLTDALGLLHDAILVLYVRLQYDCGHENHVYEHA